MANQLKKITARAKQLRKKHPNAKWTSLIKQAGKEYRTGKIGAVRKRKAYQTGSSGKRRDAMFKAKAPGKRRSSSGRTYTERRKNRSDLPGKLTGITAAQLQGELKRRLKDQLGKQLVKRETATTRRSYNVARDRVTMIRKSLNKLDR